MRRGAAGAALAAMVTAGAARAQAPPACDGRPVQAIRIVTRDLYDGAQATGWVPRLAESLSWRTRTSVVAGDLLLRPGDPCDPGRLAESERLMRNQPYLRSATVTAVDAPGGVDLEVETRDDWTLGGTASVDVSGDSPIRMVRLTESNFFGYGVLGSVQFDNRGRRPGLVGRLMHRHVVGRNYLALDAGRSSVGPVFDLSVYRPFDTEYERVGWLVGARDRRDPFEFRSDSFALVTQPYRNTSFGVHAARRFGSVGAVTEQALVGFAVLMTRNGVSDPALAAEPAQDSAVQAVLAGRYPTFERVSLNAMIGARRIRNVERMHLDAVNAVEDVREGVEARLLVGRGLPVGGGRSDWLVLAEAYAAGAAFGRSMLFVRARVEGRRTDATGDWNDVIASGDAMAYTPLGRRGVLVAGVTGAGGWSMLVPFQLDLTRAGTMRGYSQRLPVGRRLVGHLEHRHYAGTVRGAADVGWVAFVDAGRGWAAGAPFATDIRTRVAVGTGLRLALPPGSQFVLRADLSAGVSGARGWDLRIITRQAFGILRPEPGDVTRSRQPLATQPPFNSFGY